MFRAMSTRKVHGGYDKLISEFTTNDENEMLDAKMMRSATLPANYFDKLPVKFELEPKVPKKVDLIEKEAKKVSKVHPFFSLFERWGRKKKPTSKPEFSRYMEYLKEEGSWDTNSVKPVIY